MQKDKKQYNRRKYIIGLSVILIILSLLFSSYYERDKDFKIVKNLDIFYNMFKELNLFYVDELDPQELIEESIDGMLESLDPYTTYIPADEKQDFTFQTTGQYGGIGALIQKDEDYVIISEPYKGFPADKAGLIAGDMIISINGESAKDKGIREVSNLLKGTPNTDVNVTIKRPVLDKEIDVVITREKITINSVAYYDILEDKTGYIKLRKFTDGATQELKSALTDLRDNKDANAIILDLRNNPGGLLKEAVSISNLFIEKGKVVVKTKGKIEKWSETHETTDQPFDEDIKLIVLINGASASASEIVAGCMQDYDRAVVVGEKSFGKGLVQTTRPLSYNAQLKVTTARYYIPSGRCIQSLDYFNRNEDGSAAHMPDSLATEYKTENGRSVFNVGGISPDITVDSEEMSNIAVSLYTKRIIFDFATRVAAKYDTIPPPSDYLISDALYAEFKNFIKDKDIDYQTQSDKKLKELISAAKKEKYYNVAEKEIENLKNKLAHDVNKDLVVFEDEIKKLLTEEIVGRYYYQEGKIITALRFDPQVDSAKNVATAAGKYENILSVQ
jgi:carboxyl-terminal processing protease